jgi:ribonuclease-3
MPELVVIFRTQSDVEASIVRGLLETHGIPAVIASDVPHRVFPLSIADLGEVRLSVRDSDAEEAHRIIEGHRTELGSAPVVPIRKEFEGLQTAIGYRFRDRGLLEHAMTHTSRANEDITGGVVDNESLEFLGDAVLGFVIADTLFREFPAWDEGEKSKTKASMVSTFALAKQAERLQLGEHLLLGRGEEKTGGRRKPALLADTYEALIAAVYLDGGIDAARAFIAREFRTLIEAARLHGVAGQDYKSGLQELVQARSQPLPEYRLVGTFGPDHEKRFEVEVRVAGESLARASGPSKKEAEQEAAKRALENLRSAGL